MIISLTLHPRNVDMQKLIVVTGAAGFIGSVVAKSFFNAGAEKIVIVDDFSREEKNKNFQSLSFIEQVHRDDLSAWIERYYTEVEFIVHLGARTDTAEFDSKVFDRLNLNYSKKIWALCSQFQIPFIYASSAATYGNGEWGYEDNHDIIRRLKPLNPYGESKNDFDKFILEQQQTPPFWYGFKFFNVYGPNEFHKARMASVVFHGFHQMQKSGEIKLFRSHKEGFEDGQQLRDFIYVKDIAKVLQWFVSHRPQSGIFNLGTGKARSFFDLAKNVFIAADKDINISFIEMPLDIRDKYQYFTEAKMDKIRKVGYLDDFISLEQGISEYVKIYLSNQRYF